jgi:hypothetical protein
MKVRALDSNHDWTFGSGLANYKKDSDAVKQCVLTRLKSFLYNYFLDQYHGVNWFKHLSKNPDVEAMRQDIKNNVFAVDGIASIDSLDIKYDTIARKAYIQLQYTDIYNVSNTVNTDASNN